MAIKNSPGSITRLPLSSISDICRGVIVNVSSTAAKRPSTGMPHYSVTKAAVLSLSRLVADQYVWSWASAIHSAAQAAPRAAGHLFSSITRPVTSGQGRSDLVRSNWTEIP